MTVQIDSSWHVYCNVLHYVRANVMRRYEESNGVWHIFNAAVVKKSGIQTPSLAWNRLQKYRQYAAIAINLTGMQKLRRPQKNIYHKNA